MRTVYGEDFADDDTSMHQVAFAPSLDWYYRPPPGSSTKDCDKYSYDEDTTAEELVHIARCTYPPEGPIKPMSFSKRFPKLAQACVRLNGEKLPACFYHLVKTLRAFPSRGSMLFTTTAKLGRQFNFKNTPPDLAFILLDAIRSSISSEVLYDPEQLDRLSFIKDLPRSYTGEDQFANACGYFTDEQIKVKDSWRNVAACRYKQNGKINAIA